MTIWKLIVPPAAVIAILVVGFSHGFTANLSTPSFAPFGYGPIFTALPTTGVIFAYLGFRQPVEMAAEAKSPGRDIWRALVGVTLTGIAIYTLLEVAFLGASPGTAVPSVRPALESASGPASPQACPCTRSRSSMRLWVSAWAPWA
ncbi:amino acid permease [Thermogymnomonas acidicola]|uniref:amino acid permease n=1 Tax=Thermogymnomonas acidicola TaxID=399579 RepID=UPI000946739C|nr:amino acid permease [Thermogymnomonas acidicola]